MASPKTLSITRIPRTYHQEQMHQIRQSIRSQIQVSSNPNKMGNTGRNASISQGSRAAQMTVSNRR